MSHDVVRKVIEEVCEEIEIQKISNVLELVTSLLDEEQQVSHQIRPNRILQRLSNHIDQHIEGD